MSDDYGLMKTLDLSTWSPVTTFRRLFDAAYLANGALSNTLIAATPLAFTGLAASATGFVLSNTVLDRKSVV